MFSNDTASSFLNNAEIKTAEDEVITANKTITMIVLATALAACEGPKAAPEIAPLIAPPLASPPALSRPGAPAARPTTLHSSTSERTRVAADGSVHTTRTSTSVSFDPNKAAAAVDSMLAAPARPTMSEGSLPGTWTSRSSSNGAGCTVALYGDASAQQGAASSSCNTAGSLLSGASAWGYANGKLTIYKGSDVAMVFHRTSGNRFDGTAKWGFLTTTITLYR